MVSKRSTDAIKTLGEHFVIHAHADAKMVRHLEITTRHYRSIEFRSQPFQETISIAISQLHERSRAPIGPDGRNVRLLHEKLPKQFAICVHDPASFFTKQIQALENGDGEK